MLVMMTVIPHTHPVSITSRVHEPLLCSLLLIVSTMQDRRQEMGMADRQHRWQADINAPLGATPLGAKASEHLNLIRKEGNTDPSHDDKILRTEIQVRRD